MSISLTELAIGCQWSQDLITGKCDYILVTSFKRPSFVVLTVERHAELLKKALESK